jgi:hypothetical protein
VKQDLDQVYSKVLLQNMSSVNTGILSAFQAMSSEEYNRQTHFFHGRYENIYIDDSRIPQLKILIDRIREQISNFLKADIRQIKMGFWLNVMMPGDKTTRHCHDDLDEVLSGVYYVRVPAQSGNLILYAEDEIEIEPQENMLVFFSPAVEHEVLVNTSKDIRLSIGFNACLLAENPAD